MFRAIWEFAQSQDCVTHSQNPEIAFQSRDCATIVVRTLVACTIVARSRDCTTIVRNLQIAQITHAHYS